MEDHLKALSDKVKLYSNSILTEEAMKTAIVLPFLRILGYDVFDPNEVVPEFIADAVGKKGEKVDYVIRIENEIRILIECKPIATQLEKKHLDQLFRYFTVTKARFAILTNGRFFEFYTDLDEPNKLDLRPFYTFDILDLNQSSISELKKFEKSTFNIENILATAERLKYTSGVKSLILKLLEEPTEEFVKILTAEIYSGRFKPSMKEMLSHVVKNAFREVILDAVKARLSNALAETQDQIPLSKPDPELPESEEPDVETTDEEIDGFLILKAIVRSTISPARISMRDNKNYCAILIDDNNRRPLARLHFNRANKYIGLFDKDAEEKVAIQNLDDIFSFSDRLKMTAEKYL